MIEKRTLSAAGWLSKKASKWGISLEEVILLSQQRCALCSASSSAEGLEIDHDHRHCSGRYGCRQCIRGILCRGCNISLARYESLSAAQFRMILPYRTRRPLIHQYSCTDSATYAVSKSVSKVAHGRGVHPVELVWLRETFKRCNLCREHISSFTKNFAVDHSHSCTKCAGSGCRECVRGLLCTQCNYTMGHVDKLLDSTSTISHVDRYINSRFFSAHSA